MLLARSNMFLTVKCKRNKLKKKKEKEIHSSYSTRVLNTILFRLFCTIFFSLHLVYNIQRKRSPINRKWRSQRTAHDRCVWFVFFLHFAVFVCFGRRLYAFIQTAHHGRHEEKRNETKWNEERKKIVKLWVSLSLIFSMIAVWLVWM